MGREIPSVEKPKPYSDQAVKEAVREEEALALQGIKLREKIKRDEEPAANRNRKEQIKDAQREGRFEDVSRLTKEVKSDPMTEDEIARELRTEEEAGVSPRSTRKIEIESAQEEADKRNYERENNLLLGAMDGLFKGLLGTGSESIVDIIHERALEENEAFDRRRARLEEELRNLAEVKKFRDWQREKRARGE